MRGLSAALFKGICLGFSALLLVMSLLGYVRLTALGQEAAELEQRIACLREENSRLALELECSVSLPELERYALEELGMQTPSPGQIFHIDISELG